MKVLLIDKFLFPKGGASISNINTGKLLIKQGHDVVFWGMDHPKNPVYPHNDLFVSYRDLNHTIGVKNKIKTTFDILYSLEAKKKIQKLINIERPDIAHINNIAHQISPSILDVFYKYNIPVVMTIRDSKLVCPSYSLVLNGQPCDKCKDGKYFNCLLHKCTKGSYSKSLINTMEMYLHHKFLHIYNKIDTFISPSQFLAKKIKTMGFRHDILYLPNFIILKEYSPNFYWNERSLICFGLLLREKGLFTLLDAVKDINIAVKIIGDGPIKEALIRKIKTENIQNVFLLGYKREEELKNDIRQVMAVIMPSECQENNPRSIMESYALGKPVIGSNIGGIPELIINEETGFLFEPGNSQDLREKILKLLNNEKRIIQMGEKARRFVEVNFDSEIHYKELMNIYQSTIKRKTYKV